MTRSKIDPSKIPDSAWTLVEITSEYRRYTCPIDDQGSFALKTEFIESEKFIADNQQEYNDSYGQRFGDLRKVASIPLNVLYSQQSQLIEKIRQGDSDHMKWWLNSEQARPYRTFRGRV